MVRTIPIEALPLLFATTVLWVFLLYAWNRYRDGDRGSKMVLFILLLASAGLWSLFEGMHVVVVGREAVVFWEVMSTAIGSLSSVVWLLFMLAYTDRTRYLRWRWVGIVSAPFLVYLWLAVVERDRLVTGTETVTYRGEQFLDVILSDLAVAFLLYFTLLAFVGTAFAIEIVVRRRYQDRRQGVALALVGLLPGVVSMAQILGGSLHPALNLVPITYAVTGPLLGYAIFRYDLLDPARTVHRVAFETMPEAAVVVDDDARVVGINPAGRELFELDASVRERPVDDILGEHPELVDALTATETTAEVSLTVDGTQRHFSMTTRPVAFRHRPAGTLLLLTEVTALKAREEDLELLKRIQSRVLRHNIRNDTQVASGFAEVIADEHQGTTEQRAEKIVDTLDRLSETTEKARRLAAVVDDSDEQRRHELSELVDQVTDRVRTEYPEVTVRTDVSGTAAVQAHPALEVALWNLLENAAVHAKSPTVDVRVQRNGDHTTVTVSDDGPGIPEHELSVLDDRSESALEHGSGAGLWLIDLIVDLSDGTITFETSDSGTTVSLVLPQAESG